MKGNIILQEISGIDYFKTKVEEKFEVKAGKASWKNKFENSSAIYKGEMYSNLYGNSPKKIYAAYGWKYYY